MKVRPAEPRDDEAVATLFAQYGEAFAYELGDQDVAAEGRAARSKYAPPRGALLVAEAEDGAVVGCGAIEDWGEGPTGPRCRMKRMFVLPTGRGTGAGRALAEGLLSTAAEAGYVQMVLDTSKPMQAATALYRSLGFEEFVPDYDAPCREVVYMQRALPAVTVEEA